MDKNQSSSLFTTLLLILFIGLKLAGVIDWSWWWVFSPLWIPLLAFIIIVIFLFMYKRRKK